QPGIAEDGMLACRDAARRLLAMADAADAPGPSLRILLAHLDNHLADATELVAMMLARRDLWLRHLDMHGLDSEKLETNLTDEAAAMMRALSAALPPRFADAVMRIARRAREYLLDGDAVSDKNAWVVELGSLDETPTADANDVGAWKLLRHFLLTKDGVPRSRLTVDCGFPPKNAVFLEKGQAEQHK